MKTKMMVVVALGMCIATQAGATQPSVEEMGQWKVNLATSCINKMGNVGGLKVNLMCQCLGEEFVSQYDENGNFDAQIEAAKDKCLSIFKY